MCTLSLPPAALPSAGSPRPIAPSLPIILHPNHLHAQVQPTLQTLQGHAHTSRCAHCTYRSCWPRGQLGQNKSTHRFCVRWARLLPGLHEHAQAPTARPSKWPTSAHGRLPLGTLSFRSGLLQRTREPACRAVVVPPPCHVVSCLARSLTRIWLSWCGGRRACRRPEIDAAAKGTTEVTGHTKLFAQM